MNLADLESFADSVLKAIKTAAPVIGSVTGPTGAAIGAAVGQVAGALDTALTEATTDAEIIASGDVGRITALQAQLQAENADLAAQVAAS